MYAIQWGLIISGCISSIPALQAIIAPGKSLRTLQDVLPEIKRRLKAAKKRD